MWVKNIHMKEKTGKKVGKYHPPEEYQFKPGYDPKRGHRPKGSKNFETYLSKAWEEIAEKLKLPKDPDIVKVEIVKVGIKKALQGDFRYWESLMNRLFGKPPEQIKLENEAKIEQYKEFEEKVREILKAKNKKG